MTQRSEGFYEPFNESAATHQLEAWRISYGTDFHRLIALDQVI
jgi:hypothetical protein